MNIKNILNRILLVGCVVMPCTFNILYAQEEEIPLTEDLMREHGLLNRILLIYEEIARRLEHNDFQHNVLKQVVDIVESFIENYHEKLEEDYVFPLFEKHNKERELVRTLRKQHSKGREITQQLKKYVQTSRVDKKNYTTIVRLLKKFVTMYRPHEAREDTVLFPQVRSLINEQEFNALSELFEDKEHELFGKEGFFMMVKKVAAVEKELGIYNLAQFTPKLG